MSATRRIQTVIGLLIALGLPFCHRIFTPLFAPLGERAGGEAFWWLLFAVVLLYVLLVERRPLSSLGYRRPGALDLVLGVLAAIVAVVGIGIVFQIALPALHLSVNRQMSSLLAAPFLFRAAIVTRAAFVEETLFRGYGFERIAEWSGSPALAALATWALFTLAHLTSWGWGQVIIAAWGGLALTALYWWRRNLWANILCHWLTDGAGFLLMPAMVPHH
ncbi:MAG TPA: CPBP family intramembrane glutamic endopeptidase [Rhizomicrobium sp.]|nr:CPBP family intramembrane glutamic endopeptidase [Rhizomicrobium sp.]